MLPPFQLEQTINQLVREDWGRILASLVASYKDWQLAEDVLQDAVAQAVIVWKKDGLPDSPAAWLLTTARRKAIDQFRKDKRYADLLPEFERHSQLLAHTEEFNVDIQIPDNRLELIFSCCHPAIDQKTAVALTLRTLGGLTTDEIANAFLDKSSAMAQRLARAKHKISNAGIPFEVPEPEQLNERLSAVLAVIYLIFNEGYSASSGDSATRIDLSDEAIRLARIIRELLPEQPEVAGLLSLMLLHDSRRIARTDKNNGFVSLERQNRNTWDKAKIREGTTLLKATLAKQQIGAYQLQAAISAIHAESAEWSKTDWQQICALYELLFAMQPSPVIKVNHAVAVSYAEGPESALTLLETVANEPRIKQYQPFYATRADVHLRAGYAAKAKKDYKKAIDLSDNQVQKDYLQSRYDELA